ncbi:MAG: DUF5805 domain-containing protein [Halodesulfurarchaeum sp.]
MADADVDTERAVVTTYVPAYQKEQWETHADSLDMSLSEFVRSMVQAGRRGFGAEDTPEGEGESSVNEVEDDGSRPSTPGGDIRKTVLQTLEEEGSQTWEELVEIVTDDIEDDLETTLDELQEANTIIYRPRKGGYTLQE